MAAFLSRRSIRARGDTSGRTGTWRESHSYDDMADTGLTGSAPSGISESAASRSRLDRDPMTRTAGEAAAPGELTLLLRRWKTADPEVQSRLVDLVYPELRKLADRYI